MFAGSLAYTVDGKGRVVIPPHFRRKLGERFVITRAPGGCLLILSLQQWQQLLAGHAETPEFRDYFVSGAAEVTPDPSSGRVLIPLDLRIHASIRTGDEVIVAGIGSAVSIAPADVWSARLRRIEQGLLAALDKPAPKLWSDRFQLVSAT